MSAPNPQLLITQPPAQSVLLIAEGLIRVESPRPMPGWWVRWWTWALLGWRWERL